MSRFYTYSKPPPPSQRTTSYEKFCFIIEAISMVYNVHEIFRRSRIVRTTGIFFQYQDLKSRFVSWIFFSPVPGFEILVPGIFYCMADKSVLKKPNLCPLEGGVCFAPRTFPHPKHITFHNIYCGNRASHPTLALLFSQHFV